MDLVVQQSLQGILKISRRHVGDVIDVVYLQQICKDVHVEDIQVETLVGTSRVGDIDGEADVDTRNRVLELASLLAGAPQVMLVTLKRHTETEQGMNGRLLIVEFKANRGEAWVLHGGRLDG
jgi:hypothetical protein